MDTENVNIHLDHAKIEESACDVHSYWIKSLFNSVGISVIILDLKGIIIHANPFTQEMIGYSLQEMIGQSAIQYIHPDDQADTKSKLWHVIHGDKKPYSVERRFIKKDGRILWADMSISTIRDSRNEVIGIIGIAKDISTRKQIESALRASQEQYHYLINQLPDAVLVIQDNRFVFCNSIAGTILESSRPEELIGLGFDSVLDRSSLPTIQSYLKKIEKIIDYQQTEFPILTRSGKSYWIDATALPIQYNEKPGTLIIAQNITDKKKIEDEAHQEREKIKTYLDVIDVIIMVLDRTGTISMINQKGCRLLGYVPSQLIGRNWFDLLIPIENRESDKNRFHQIMEMKEPCLEYYENIIIDSQGHQLNIIWHCALLRDDNQSIGGIICSGEDITDQRRIDEELRESEGRYRALVETIPGAVYRCEVCEPWKMEMISTGIESISGYPLSMFKEGPLQEFSRIVHPDDIPEMEAKIQQAVNHHQIYHLEYRIIHQNGSICWIYDKGQAIYDLLGRPTCIEGVLMDISDKKKAESAFLHSEEKYQMLIQKIQAAVMVHDRDNHLLLLNQKAYQLLGITNPEQWDPETFDKEWIMLDEKGEVIPPEAYPAYQVIQTQQPLSDRTLGLRKTKGHKVLWVTVNAIPLFDEYNHFFQVVVTFMDISPQKKAEQIIQQNNERLESLLRISQYSANSSDDLINMVLLEALKLSESRYGFIYTYQEKESTLLHHSSIRMDQDYQPTVCIINPMEICLDWCREAISERKPIRKKNLKIQRDDLSISNALIIPVIIDDEVKAIIGIADKAGEYTSSDNHQITLMMDTVWKILEKFKNREELIKAKEKAEEGDRLKSAFLCNMSHEIRTPMNGIIGFANLLNTSDLSDQKRIQYTTIINESCQQLLSVVNDILDISKIETGQMQINSETTNVNNILLELFSFFKPTAAKSNLNLYFKRELSDQESIISIDRIKLKQILSNLISNAIKFTHQGYIEYGYQRLDDSLKFFIKDTGIGIPTEFHSIIFDRFRQAETSLTRQYGGTGLGLAISKAYVELMGGKIWLNSSPTDGSTFFFTIPYHPVFPTQPETIQSNPVILVAEDEETNYFYIEQVLLDKKYTILHAKNGKEAVACCQGNNRINLVLMDIKMPIMNGIEAAKQIKSFRPQLIIVAQTAFAMAEDRQQMINHGFDDYISKPMTQEQLLACVEKWVESPVIDSLMDTDPTK